MKNLDTRKNQNGASTLLTALILLICITLVVLLSSKTVVMETQISADNYRMAQAVAAANAAMDFGVGYFDGAVYLGVDCDPSGGVVAGFDHNGDTFVDTIDPECTKYTSDDGTQTTTASLTFNNVAGTRCVAAGETPNMKSGLITAVGRSDDGLAVRTMSQCVGTIDIFGGNGPKQPLVSKAAVGLTGNYKIINRFNNTTIWSGESATIGMSASAATYLREQSTPIESLSKTELENIDTSNAYTSEPVTDRDKGNGVDTIDKDPRLSTLTGDEFFNNFFFDDRSTMQAMAKCTSLADTSCQTGGGIVWVEGNASMSGGTYGTPDSPVVIIINGNLDMSGNPTIYGMLYVTGQMDATGTPTVYGSVIVEGDPAMVPAGEDPVVGHGTVNLVYTPFTLNQAANPIIGTTTVISGSWRDW